MLQSKLNYCSIFLLQHVVCMNCDLHCPYDWGEELWILHCCWVDVFSDPFLVSFGRIVLRFCFLHILPLCLHFFFLFLKNFLAFCCQLWLKTESKNNSFYWEVINVNIIPNIGWSKPNDLLKSTPKFITSSSASS